MRVRKTGMLRTCSAETGARVSELEFLGALHVEMLRHGDLRPATRQHELFQTSTIEALLGGAFDGDVSLAELLEHGDLGLGTLNGLDGELIVIEGDAWKATAECELLRATGASLTPYAVVVAFSPGPSVALCGPLRHADLGQALRHRLKDMASPTAIRIDGRFAHVRVRSVPKQRHPYPRLAEALAQQRVRDLHDVSGTMVGFGFPDALDGIEMIGWHLHFATGDRTRGGHMLDFTLEHGVAHLDDATELKVELPPAVEVHHHDALPDQAALRRLEFDG
jgi:acetolactate decarboxylase